MLLSVWSTFYLHNQTAALVNFEECFFQDLCNIIEDNQDHTMTFDVPLRTSGESISITPSIAKPEPEPLLPINLPTRSQPELRKSTIEKNVFCYRNEKRMEKVVKRYP